MVPVGRWHLLLLQAVGELWDLVSGAFDAPDQVEEEAWQVRQALSAGRAPTAEPWYRRFPVQTVVDLWQTSHCAEASSNNAWPAKPGLP